MTDIAQRAVEANTTTFNDAPRIREDFSQSPSALPAEPSFLDPEKVLPKECGRVDLSKRGHDRKLP